MAALASMRQNRPVHSAKKLGFAFAMAKNSPGAAKDTLRPGCKKEKQANQTHVLSAFYENGFIPNGLCLGKNRLKEKRALCLAVK